MTAKQRSQAVRALAEKLYVSAYSQHNLDDDQQVALNALDTAKVFYEVLEAEQSQLAKAKRVRAKRAAARAARATKAGST